MIQEILRQIVGKRLTHAIGAFHVYEGRRSEKPVSVWLGFDWAQPYRFAGAPDGWHLLVDEVSPTEIDMQESGAIRLRDLRGERLIADGMNHSVLQGWLISSPLPTDVIGVRFDFDGSTLRVLNWGDELYVGEGLPSDAESQEIREWAIR